MERSLGRGRGHHREIIQIGKEHSPTGLIYIIVRGMILGGQTGEEVIDQKIPGVRAQDPHHIGLLHQIDRHQALRGHQALQALRDLRDPQMMIKVGQERGVKGRRYIHQPRDYM